MRPFSVREAANGWIVEIGCQTFVYVSLSLLVSDFEAYLVNPAETEREILNDAQNYQRQMQTLGEETALRQCDACAKTPEVGRSLGPPGLGAYAR